METAAVKTASKRLPSWFYCLAFVLVLVPGIGWSAAAQEDAYVYERMWPALSQPWFFKRPSGVAVAGQGVATP